MILRLVCISQDVMSKLAVEFPSVPESAMPVPFEAIYENGVLKPVGPLPLKENEKVTVTIHGTKSWVEETYGNLG
jgi:predicted DNA-binding antitoxin AbrB/MazE fold protein